MNLTERDKQTMGDASAAINGLNENCREESGRLVFMKRGEWHGTIGQTERI